MRTRRAKGRGIWLPWPTAICHASSFASSIVSCFCFHSFDPERERIFRQWLGRGKSKTVSTTTQSLPSSQKDTTHDTHAVAEAEAIVVLLFSHTSRLLLPWTGFSVCPTTSHTKTCFQVKITCLLLLDSHADASLGLTVKIIS
jgi:hypothetical protein